MRRTSPGEVQRELIWGSQECQLNAFSWGKTLGVCQGRSRGRRGWSLLNPGTWSPRKAEQWARSDWEATAGRSWGQRDLAGSRKVTLLMSHKCHSGLGMQEGRSGVESVGRGCFRGSPGRPEGSGRPAPGRGWWGHSTPSVGRVSLRERGSERRFQVPPALGPQSTDVPLTKQGEWDRGDSFPARGTSLQISVGNRLGGREAAEPSAPRRGGLVGPRAPGRGRVHTVGRGHCVGKGSVSTFKEPARLGLRPWVSPGSVSYLRSRRLSKDEAKAKFQLQRPSLPLRSGSRARPSHARTPLLSPREGRHRP